MPKLRKATLIVLATLVVLAAAIAGGTRYLDTALSDYRGPVAQRIGERIGQPVTIGNIDLAWNWRGPVLRLADVSIGAGDDRGAPLLLQAVALQYALIDLLRARTTPARVGLVGADLALIRDADGVFRLRGARADETKQPFDLLQTLSRLQKIERLRIVDSRLRLSAAASSLVLQLRDVNIVSGQLDGSLQLRAEAAIQGMPDATLDAQAIVSGDATRPAIEASLQASGLAASRLLALTGLEDTGQLRGGQGEAGFQAQWRQGRFAGAQGNARFTAINTTRAGAAPQPLAPALSVKTRISAEDGQLRVALAQLESPVADRVATTGTVTVDPATGVVRGSLSQLPAPLAAAALRVWRPHDLASLSAEGLLPHLEFDHRPGQRTHLLAEFVDLDVRHRRRGISVGRLQGRFTLGDQGGTVRLRSGQGELVWPRYLASALPLLDASGEIAWQPAADKSGASLLLTDLRLATAANTVVSGGGHLRLPEASAPVANLGFQLISDDVTAIVDRIPQGDHLRNPLLRRWLAQALRGGQITDGRVRLRGPLDRFPFAAGGGIFNVDLEAKAVTLAYKPEWPPLENVDATVAIAGTRLDVRAERGSTLGVALGATHAYIDDLAEPVLAITGTVPEADAGALFGFLSRSPLAEQFGRLVKVLDISGRAGLDLVLSIPLEPGRGPLTVDGRIALADVALGHAVLPTPIQGLRGSLRFDRKGLTADDLAGRFLGMPIQAELQPAAGDGLAIAASAQMRLPEQAPALAAVLPPALLARGHGATEWTAKLKVWPGGRVAAVRLTSDLAGLALALPAPLGKRAAPAVPLDLRLTGNRSRATIDYGKRLHAELRLAHGRPQALNLRFGDETASAPNTEGLWVDGRLPVVDISAWRSLAAEFNGGAESALAALPLRGAKVRAAGLLLAGQAVGPLAVRVVPLTAGAGWQAEISGKGASGNLRWNSSGPRPAVAAEFQRLALQVVPSNEPIDEPESSNDHAANAKPLDPGALPTLDIWIDNLSVDQSRLGSLQINASALTDGLALDTLKLQGTDIDATAEGRWRRANGESRASLTASLTGTGIDRVLQALGYAPTVRAETADITADLRFAPQPDGLAAAALNGRLSMALENGTLISVEPGAGRVLGLVNFYALPRRLLLDFRDVLGDGTAFDSVRGDFRIDSGNARTDNLRIETPSSRIRIRGRIGLATQDYDERVTITPKLSSAAAIAGTVLGGPVVGAALLVAQRLLRKPIAEISRLTYRLTGSWSDPQIERVVAEDQAS